LPESEVAKLDMQIADYQNRFGSITELEGAINNMEHKQKLDK
jgi:hypothetical protein